MVQEEFKAKIDWEKCENPYVVEGEGSQDTEQEQMGMIFNDNKLEIMHNMHEIICKKYDMWTIHTNFYITPVIQQAIEFTDGVEVFSVESPYRASIGIGKLFNKEDVSLWVGKNTTKILYGNGDEDGEQSDFVFEF